MDKVEVLKLAKLARINIPEGEISGLVKDFESILGYIGEIREVSGLESEDEPSSKMPAVRNILREDTSAHEPGQYRQEILANATNKDRDYIKVKKIL